jgi:DNA-directed RNA polymerase specialized sigma24 family protein
VARCNNFAAGVVLDEQAHATTRGSKIGGLMVKGRDRTEESFQRLASAELPALYWVARRLVRDGAEDLVQEALLRAYRSYGTLRQDTAAGPWLNGSLLKLG